MKIQIIGNGNVGCHLRKAIEILNPVSVNPHTLDGLDTSADVTIIAVKDDAIAEVASSLPAMDGIIVHTAGSVGMDVLSKHNRRGVFYPLQTFSKKIELDYSQIPVYIETYNKEDETILKEIGSIFTEKIFNLDSEKRRKLHIASVFACNFCNYLWTISEDILTGNGLDFSEIKPLISETFKKMDKASSPQECQTGPAVRKDRKVIDAHIHTLAESGYENYADIYRLLSDSIMKVSSSTHSDTKGHSPLH